jgi:pyrroline-5-carboxylate reductase
MPDSVLDMNASESPSVGVLGVGQLAEHLVEGLCGASVSPGLLLSPRSRERAEALAQRYSLEIASDNQSVVDRSDVVILSVPTDEAIEVASALSFDKRHVVVCVAAGLKHEPLARAALPAKTVRAMPATSASVRETATVLYPGDDQAEKTLGLIGTVHVFDDENAFEVASIAAVYYGWVFALMAEISGWLESRGIDGKEAKTLVAQMTRGACAMCMEGGKDMATEDRVIGRSGTYTGLGLDILRRMDALSAWSETLDAVLDASRRGKPD